MWRDPAGDDKFMNAPVRDISESGVGLQIPEPVAVRSFVTLSAEQTGDSWTGFGPALFPPRRAITSLACEFTGGFKWRPAEEPAEEASRPFEN